MNLSSSTRVRVFICMILFVSAYQFDGCSSSRKAAAAAAAKSAAEKTDSLNASASAAKSPAAEANAPKAVSASTSQQAVPDSAAARESAVSRNDDAKKIMEMIQNLGAELKEKIEKESAERKQDKATIMSMLDAHAAEKKEPESAVTVNKNAHLDELLVDSYLERLKEGNQRFVKGTLAPKNIVKQRAALVSEQHPFAIVLACSDSRVSPELLFDETLGKLFIVRDAGNVADSVTLGSIEYAVEHLHVKLLIVLGHTSCGAVQATLDGGAVPPNIGAIANRIALAADRAKAKHLDAKATALEASTENVRLQIDACTRQSRVLHESVDRKELRIVGAVYHLDSGKVVFQ